LTPLERSPGSSARLFGSSALSSELSATVMLVPSKGERL
jgi:hypothetical protein